VRLLRREIEALGYTHAFTIYDQADQLQVVKAAMKDLKVDDRLITARTIQSRISHAKNHGKTAQNLIDDSWEPSGNTRRTFSTITKTPSQIKCAGFRRPVDQSGRVVR
jgi:superfamily I DNA/RNA helicase